MEGERERSGLKGVLTLNPSHETLNPKSLKP